MAATLAPTKSAFLMVMILILGDLSRRSAPRKFDPFYIGLAVCVGADTNSLWWLAAWLRVIPGSFSLQEDVYSAAFLRRDTHGNECQGRNTSLIGLQTLH